MKDVIDVLRKKLITLTGVSEIDLEFPDLRFGDLSTLPKYV